MNPWHNPIPTVPQASNMLFTVLRISRAHSAISNAAFSHARPTVSSLVATRSFLTTAWVEAAKKDAKSTKTTRATAKKVKSKVSGSKAAEKSEKEKALAKTKKESGLKEKVAKATEKVLTKEKAKARREKALAIKKANALKLKEKAKLQREKVRLIRQKVNEEKEKERCQSRIFTFVQYFGNNLAFMFSGDKKCSPPAVQEA